jgi:hypothetical protein
MWRARFRKRDSDQWLWTLTKARTARDAALLAKRIQEGHTAQLLDARGILAPADQVDRSHGYYVVPAEDLGYAPSLARF